MLPLRLVDFAERLLGLGPSFARYFPARHSRHRSLPSLQLFAARIRRTTGGHRLLQRHHRLLFLLAAALGILMPQHVVLRDRDADITNLQLRGIAGSILFQLLANIGRQHLTLVVLGAQGFDDVVLLAPLLMRTPRQAPIQLRAGQCLEQLGALIRGRMQERVELALRQQHRATELAEIEPQSLLDRGQYLGATATRDDCVLTQVMQDQLLILQPTIGTTARAPNRPTRTIRNAIATDKVHFGVPIDGVATQQRSRIVGAQPIAAFLPIITNQRATAAGQSRRAIEQRQAQRIEQRALAGSDWTRDCEQSSVG